MSSTEIGRVTSSDGTSIAYERVGAGPAVILVDAAGMSPYRLAAISAPALVLGSEGSSDRLRNWASRVPFQVPAEAEHAGRLSSVLHVLYLIYNEGYVAASGARLFRQELSGGRSG
jgi:hypothetical protein